MSEREHAHELVDRLPQVQRSALIGLLETMVDPVSAALRNPPVDDEPETEDEREAIVAAHRWLADHGGKGIPHEEAMRRLGLE